MDKRKLKIVGKVSLPILDVFIIGYAFYNNALKVEEMNASHRSISGETPSKQ